MRRCIHHHLDRVQGRRPLAKKKAGTNKSNPNCVGENVSPPLSWSNPPAGTKSYVRLTSDPEGRGRRRQSLDRLRHPGLGDRLCRRRDVSKPSDKYVGGKGTAGQAHYLGPCTPPGPPHHYTFILIATDLDPRALPPGLTRGAVRKASPATSRARRASSGCSRTRRRERRMQRGEPDPSRLLSFVHRRHLDGGMVVLTTPFRLAASLPPFFFRIPSTSARVDQPCSLTARSGSICGSLIEAMLAFVIGSVAGVLIGFWFAQQPRVAAVFDPYVKMINALPRVVLAPIFTLWFGLGIWSKVALGVTLVFFIVFFNVYQGVKEVSPTVLANARMLGMNDRQLMRHVYWPSALSWMFSSLHTSVGFAVVGAVVGEYLGSAAGLGYLIQQAEGVFDVAGVFAGMFVLAAFVIAIDWLVTLVENRLLVWRPVAAETRT